MILYVFWGKIKIGIVFDIYGVILNKKFGWYNLNVVEHNVCLEHSHYVKERCFPCTFFETFLLHYVYPKIVSNNSNLIYHTNHTNLGQKYLIFNRKKGRGGGGVEH